MNGQEYNSEAGFGTAVASIQTIPLPTNTMICGQLRENGTWELELPDSTTLPQLVFLRKLFSFNGGLLSIGPVLVISKDWEVFKNEFKHFDTRCQDILGFDYRIKE
jgi:hypothetical protein